MSQNIQGHRIGSFNEFWPFYLSQHSTSQCRLKHFLGTSSAATFVCVFVMTLHATWLVWAMVVGYGFAWWGHWAHEKNQPATFKYPIYSLLADWKMFWMMLQGNLDAELKRFQI
ncbi:MAG: DUF962 domain-containing protein [Proteobacteria bacterium]|nr:DUF962 domain-containing protein [Pseudomonadota bacterium]